MPRLTHSTPQGRETLQTLREALFSLMVEKSFDQITVTDIAERAGVDRTTFYLHARDKRELFELSQRQLLDELFAGAQNVENLGQRACAGFQHMAAHARAYQALLSTPDVVTNHRMYEYLAGHIEQVVRSRAATQGLEPPLPPDLIATFATSSLRGLARWWLEHDMPYSPEEMADIFQRLIQGGLSSYIGQWW